MDRSVSDLHKKNILRESIIKITEEQQISWSDVKKKVSQGDITYTLALNIAKRKIEGRFIERPLS